MYKRQALLCLQKNATVTIAHSKTKNLKEVCKRADVLIAAIGKAKFFNHEYVKDGAIILDVGINRDENNKLCGCLLYTSEMTLKSDDIIIMSSDGTGDNFEKIINDNLDLIDQLHPQEVATLLMDKVLEDNNLDDISIIVVKVVNARNDN